MNSNKITTSQGKKEEPEHPLGEQQKMKINGVFFNVVCSLNLDVT